MKEAISKRDVIVIGGPTASGKTGLSIELAKRINLRNTPELIFEIDDSIEYGAKIDSILKEILPEERK